MPYDYYGNWYPGPQDHPGYQQGPTNVPQRPTPYNYQSGLQQYTKPQEQSQQSTPLNGRLIKDEKDIIPKEIPMDGSVSLFPKDDFSYILAKAWNSSGTIDTVKFVPDIQKPQNTTGTDNNFQLILDKLSKMEETIAKLEKEWTN